MNIEETSIIQEKQEVKIVEEKNILAFTFGEQKRWVNWKYEEVGGGGGGRHTAPAVILTIPTEILGCGMRINGFSITNGKSCSTNIPHNEGQVLGAESFHFTLLLKNGSSGNEIMELQKLLNSQLNLGLIVDGKFGPKTKVAVIKFQIANKLKGDGIVGALTRAILNK